MILFMSRLYYLFLLLALLGACSKPQPETTVDHEAVVKDDTFRQNIAAGGFIRLKDGYTYYELENPNADTMVVMVHGFSVPSYIWDSTYYATINRGYGALRYDVYGRGYSDNPDVVYDAALYSGQLKELLDSLGITQKVNLIGLSYGGRTITAFAFQYPERVNNLIYVDPAGFESIPADSVYPAMVSNDEIAAFKASDNYRYMAQGQLSDFYDSVPFKGWDKKYEDMMKYKGFVRALISTRKNSPSMEQEHRQIALSRIPVFCIWGEHDTVVPLEKVKQNMYDRIPYVELFILPKAGHLPHMEQASMFNSIIFDQIICCEHPI